MSQKTLQGWQSSLLINLETKNSFEILNQTRKKKKSTDKIHSNLKKRFSLAEYHCRITKIFTNNGECFQKKTLPRSNLYFTCTIIWEINCKKKNKDKNNYRYFCNTISLGEKMIDDSKEKITQKTKL